MVSNVMLRAGKWKISKTILSKHYVKYKVGNNLVIKMIIMAH